MMSEHHDAEVGLDAQSRALLDAGKASGAPPLQDMPIADARKSLKDLMLSLDVPRHDVDRCEQITIPGPGGPIPLRIYRLAPQLGATCATLVFFHGGGWVLGDLESYDNTCRFLCVQSGVIVVSVGYRLAPEHRFPAGLEDCYAALRWTENNAVMLGGHPSRISVGGDSAGGNLAAVLAFCARAKGQPVASQILLYPQLSLLEDPPYVSRRQFGGGDYFISSASIAWSVGLYLQAPDQARTRQASPILEENLEGAPATLIITAGFDPLRDEGQLYAERLVKAGVPVTHRCFHSTIHGFMSFSGALDAGRDALGFVTRWMREHL
jgi:acetyl esterase